MKLSIIQQKTTKVYQEILELFAKRTSLEDIYSRMLKKKLEQLKNLNNLKS